MKKLFLLFTFICVTTVMIANEVIVSSCGTSVYIPENISVEEALDIYDALEALCP